MGGPCFIVDESGKRVRGPPCTDNFQVLPFTFAGKLWQSAEQCYQAMKFEDEATQERIRLLMKRPGETDSAHGCACWDLGQRHKPRADWDKVKVQMMYDINVAKYQCNPSLGQELLQAAGTKNRIVGGNSTEWIHPKMGRQNWSLWNGLIQMRIRESLKPPGEMDLKLIQEIEALWDEYAAAY